MANENDAQQNGGGAQTKDSLLAQVDAQLNKAAKEALMGRLKANRTKRLEHQRAIAQLDTEAEAEINAFMAGL